MARRRAAARSPALRRQPLDARVACGLWRVLLGMLLLLLPCVAPLAAPPADETDAALQALAAQRDAEQARQAEAAADDPALRGLRLMSTALAPTTLTFYPTWGPVQTTNRNEERAQRKAQRVTFLRGNYAQVLQDMARGTGETLVALTALTCPDAMHRRGDVVTGHVDPDSLRTQALGTLVRGRYAQLVPAEADAGLLEQRLVDEMRRHAVFDDCRWI